ncbi:MAG: hypothetical protein MRZ85_09665 [Clostridium sp.]|nr:hypothetical protein [Clostridium sp.]
MYSVCIIAGLVCVALVLTVLTNPSINIGKYHIRIFYWTAPVLGSIALLLFRLLPLPVMWEGLTSSGSINPLKILTLFISMTTLSIYLDEVGFFSYIAGISLKFAKTSQLRLFCVLFLLVSVLTVFTSNDIIILTFTPFICYFSKKAEIDPMPYLFGEFVAANTWSMMLIIGNPTNIYLATANGIGFGTYTAHMLLPTLFAGITAFLLLLMIFRKPLSQPISIKEEKPAIRDKGLVIIGLLHLVFCTILLILSSYIGLEMWYITLGFAVSLFLCVTIYKKKKGVKERVLLHTIMRAPWELIPFVLSMFLLVLTLDRYQVTTIISDFFGTNHLVWKYGIVSFLAANVMNNIPMSVAFSSIVSHLPEADRLPAAYASIIGSNIGAYFTPLGALAGIMWSGILNKMGIPFSFRKYISYGIRISIPVLIAALLGLLIYF